MFCSAFFRRLAAGGLFATLAVWAASSAASDLAAPAAMPIAPQTSLHSSLKAALDAYWLRHPQAQALSARANAADAAQAQADGFLAGAPTMALSRLDARDGGARETEFEFSLPLAGNRDARQQQASAGRAAVAAEARWLRLTLAAELLRIDSARRYRDAALTLSQERLALVQKLEQDVGQKVDAGELARTDRLLASAETLAAQAALLDAEQAADEARSAWLLRVGTLPALPALATADTDTDQNADKPLSGDRDQHPQLLQLLAQAQAAGARARFEQRRSGDAEISLLMKREEDPLLDEQIDSAGIRFSVPLFAGASRDQNVASADAERLSAEADAQQLRQALAQEHVQARQHWQRTRQQCRLAEQQRQLTEQSWQFAQSAFAAGELSVSELLRQQQRLFDSREWQSQLQQQQADALARLILAEGVLP